MIDLLPPFWGVFVAWDAIIAPQNGQVE